MMVETTTSPYFSSFFKKYFCLLLLLLLFCSSVTVIAKNDSTASKLGATYYVDCDNIEGPWQGTSEHPYKHINDAVRRVSPGDTIYIFNGCYNEIVEIHTSDITIRGESKESTVLYADRSYCTLSILTGADRVTVTSMNIKSVCYMDGNIKMLIESDYCTISDNIFSDNQIFDTRACIFLEGADHTTIKGNIFGDLCVQLTWGVVSNNSCYTIIENNSFVAYAISMVLKNSVENQISHNTFTNTLGLVNSSRNSITRNVFPADEAVVFSNSSYNTISCNDFGRHDLRTQRSCGNQVKSFDSFNEYDQNYWGRSRALPKILVGKQTINGRQFPSFEADWHPAKTSNIIS
jgi:parallel beta-helix repeat protein